jgi:hypothetical protein
MGSRRKSAPVRVSRTYMNEPPSCAHALSLLLKGCAGESVNSSEKAPDLALDGGSGRKGSFFYDSRLRA